MSYIMCAPKNVRHCKLSMSVLWHSTQHFQSTHGCFSSLSAWDETCMRVAVTNKAITFLFNRDRRSLTLVFSVWQSWVVSDEKQAILWPRGQPLWEIALVFWYWLSVFVKTSCWDSCFPKGLSGLERSDGNSREWPTALATELLDTWSLWVLHCVPWNISYTIFRVYKC